MKCTKVILYFMISVFIMGDNFYKDYNQAKDLYNDNMITQSRYKIEKVLNEYDDYKEANVLYFKILFELSETEKYDEVIRKILEMDDKYKKDIFTFLLENENLDYLEKVYNSISNKEDIETSFLEILFEHKKYDKILQKYGTPEYISKIESQKSKADNNYFLALDYLKKNDIPNSLILLREAIRKYPFNYRYFLKIGQLYADKKNYHLAEANFKKALELSSNEKIYLNLFRLYKKTNNIEKLYQVARYIIDKEEVKRELRRLHRERNSQGKIKVLKKDSDKIYISEYDFDYSNLEVGNSYLLGRIRNEIKDNNTGEVLFYEKDKIARIRFYDNTEKILIFHVVEGRENINLKDNYILY